MLSPTLYFQFPTVTFVYVSSSIAINVCCTNIICFFTIHYAMVLKKLSNYMFLNGAIMYFLCEGGLEGFKLLQAFGRTMNYFPFSQICLRKLFAILSGTIGWYHLTTLAQFLKCRKISPKCDGRKRQLWYKKAVIFITSNQWKITFLWYLPKL